MLFKHWTLNYCFVCITIYCLYICLWAMFSVWWSFVYVDIWFDLIYDLYLYFIIQAMWQYHPVIKMKYQFKFCFVTFFWNNRKLSILFTKNNWCESDWYLFLILIIWERNETKSMRFFVGKKKQLCNIVDTLLQIRWWYHECT